MVRSPHRHVLFLALVLGAVTSVGCGTAWRVIRDGGSPSPLKGAGPITVSFDYSKLVVGGKTEQAFVEEKKMKEPGYEKTWPAATRPALWPGSPGRARTSSCSRRC